MASERTNSRAAGPADQRSGAGPETGYTAHRRAATGAHQAPRYRARAARLAAADQDEHR